jgi:hypothetical protein
MRHALALQAKANRGILYVDEVNLLDDGLVDVVLDSAASGVNTVEREGISIAHPARVTPEQKQRDSRKRMVQCMYPLHLIVRSTLS